MNHTLLTLICSLILGTAISAGVCPLYKSLSGGGDMCQIHTIEDGIETYQVKKCAITKDVTKNCYLENNTKN